MPQSESQRERTEDRDSRTTAITRPRGQDRGVPAPLRALSFTPFSVMRRLFEDMERLMGLGSQSALAGDTGTERGLSGLGVGFVPRIDMVRRDDKLVVSIDLPGTGVDDVRVRIADDALIVEGERRTESEKAEDDVWRAERIYGRFRRVIPLPEGIDTDSAEARFEHGVLEVSFRAPTQDGGRPIEVKSNERRGQDQGRTRSQTPQ